MNTFDKLKSNAQLIDKGIQELELIWDSPQSILCHRNENPEQARNMLEDFHSDIKKLRDESTDDLAMQTEYIKDMDRFLMECNTVRDELKQGIDDIETLFAEYGYVKSNINNINGNSDSYQDDNCNLSNNSVLTTDEMSHLSINSSFVNETNHVTSPVTNNIVTDNAPKYIATPVIKSIGNTNKKYV